MKLIVGLGNPGKEYEGTRHNVGFQVIDCFSQKLGITVWKTKFNGLYTETFIQGEKVILLKPQSYINLSGEVIYRFLNFYNLSIGDLLIIHDDLDLKIGTFKIKKKGSSGGHNGLKNIEFHLKTQEYFRIKIGISNNKSIDTRDYVLGKLSALETKTLNLVKAEILLLLDDYFIMNFDNLMNKYNQKKKKETPDV